MKNKKTGTKYVTDQQQKLKTNLKQKPKKTWFQKARQKIVEISFTGGNISSDGGILLLKAADDKLKLTQKIADILPDDRQASKIKHSLLSILKQRIYGIALGYEDLNDHQHLRKDLAFQTAVGREEVLASDSTLCRFEKTAERKTMVEIHNVLIEQFIDSYEKPPYKIILDFDATDDTVHGNQEKSAYNGYYGNYCFLPLYVFCGHHLLTAYLRQSNQDGAKHSWAILALLVKKIRKEWPETKIIVRGDSGFCRPKTLRWCERNAVKYVIGMGKNKVLLCLAEPYICKAKTAFDHTQEKQRIFGEIQYGAKSWGQERRIIVKAEHLEKGSNTRFVVTTLDDEAQSLYDDWYCARGDMENRIKEQKLDMFSDRTSCHKWWSNQLRILLSGIAYSLVSYIRSAALKGSQFAKAQVGTIRLKLLKIGTVVIRSTRRIRFLMPSAYPYQEDFLTALARLTPV